MGFFYNFFCNFPFLHTIQTLQFIYTTRHYTHYIDIFWSRHIYLCIELIPISQVITYEMKTMFEWRIYYNFFFVTLCWTQLKPMRISTILICMHLRTIRQCQSLLICAILILVNNIWYLNIMARQVRIDLTKLLKPTLRQSWQLRQPWQLRQSWQLRQPWQLRQSWQVHSSSFVIPHCKIQQGQ